MLHICTKKIEVSKSMQQSEPLIIAAIFKVNPRNKIAIFLFLGFGLLSADSGALSLDDLISRGVGSYPAILAKESVRNSAQIDLTSSKLKFLPSVGFNTQRNQVNFDGGSSAGQMPSTNVSITQPLLVDGGVVAGYRKADARLSMADYAVLESKENISINIINAYGEWLKAWLKMNALENSLNLHKKFSDMMQRRYEQGLSAAVDRDLATSRLMQTKAELDSQMALEMTALASLSSFVNEPISRNNLIGSIAKQVPVLMRSEGIPQSLEQSPLIKRYEYEAIAAQEEAKEIRAQALPQLSLQAQRQIGNAYYPGAQGFNAVGVVVSINTGGGFSNIIGSSAAIERAKSVSHQADTAKREQKNRLESSYNDYESALAKKISLAQSSSLSVDIAASYDRQYLVGRKNWLDLMNSIREEVQAKSQLADSEAALVTASYKLMIYLQGTDKFNRSQ